MLHFQCNQFDYNKINQLTGMEECKMKIAVVCANGKAGKLITTPYDSSTAVIR